MDYPAWLRMETETRFEEMKRYVRFTDADARRLAAFRPLAAPHFERIAREFYDRIREHGDAHAVLHGEAQIERLHRSLVAWMDRILAGPHDEEHFRQTERIGRVHVKVGLPERYVFTAMALIRAAMLDIARDKARDAESSLGRLLDLELAIMVDAYRDDLATRLVRATADAAGRDLQADLERYRTSFDLAGEILVWIDPSGAIELWSPEAERVTGYARDEAVGRDFVELLLPPEATAEERSRFQPDAELRAEPFTQRILTRAGKTREVRLRAHKDPKGSALLVAGRDVTEELTRLRHTVQRERMAAVGTLASGLAHEIRNPLNGAQLHLDFLQRALREAGASTEVREAVDVVDVELRRLARLLTDFLDLIRPRPVVLGPTSLRQVFTRAAERVPIPPDNRVTLRLDLPSADLVVAGDLELLVQVFVSLIQNAVEAVSSHGPHSGAVDVRVRREPQVASIEIEDDGPGLPAPNAPIFDPFYSTKPSGRGLGLALAHRVVTDHGGTVDVDGHAGRTRFRVKLPIMREGAGQ